MSLAEELLADFDEVDDELVADAGNEIEDVTAGVELNTGRSVRSVAKLLDSSELRDLLDEMDFFKSQQQRSAVAGPVEADPEYQLIVRANNLIAEMDNEVNICHKFAKDIYNRRFPELDSLVPTSLEYLQTVLLLGNQILKNSKNSDELGRHLTSATVMVISVSASTTQGAPLSAEELELCLEACHVGVKLNEIKNRIHDYIESRMNFIAPNMSEVVGTSVAAKLIGASGSLVKLAQMPACNILLLGAQRKALSGFSTTAVLPHTGFVYYSDIVQKQPPHIRRRLARVVASKVTLAARVDNFHEATDGGAGRQIAEGILQKVDKWLEPPPMKLIKPLPVPIEGQRKRRGGRRVRKMKERLGLTDVRKATNRMNFGEIEEETYQEDLGFSLGTLGKSTSGKVRQAPIDSKTKAKISKALQAKLQRANQSYGGSTTVKKQVAGTASSVAFTPMQGLEIVNPHAVERAGDDSSLKYFSSTSGFSSVKKAFV